MGRNSRKNIFDVIDEAVRKSAHIFDMIDASRKAGVASMIIPNDVLKHLPEIISPESVGGFYKCYLNKKYKKHSKSICKRAFEVRIFSYGLKFILRSDCGRGWYNNGSNSRKEDIQA